MEKSYFSAWGYHIRNETREYGLVYSVLASRQLGGLLRISADLAGTL